MEKRIIRVNIAFSLSLQAITLISGFVVPKVILTYFGSEINGLISSIQQFLSYIQLLEGGLSGVIMAALYKPLADNDEKKISAVINATSSFFKKLALIYGVYTVCLALIYPRFIHVDYTIGYVSTLVLVLSSNIFVQYFFSLTYKLLLNADQKVYIVALAQIVVVLFNMIAVIVLSRLFSDIIIIRLVGAAIYVIQPVVYGTYVKRHYSIDKSIPPDNKAIAQRWDGFGVNLAYFVHSNTDIVVLTFFSTLTSVSVYTVYLLIVNAMKNVVIAISQAITPSFGKILVSEDKKSIDKAFERYEFIIFFVTAFIFSCGLFLITPFVRLYTSNIHDANYEQYVFGYILVIAEMIFCFREPYVSATYAAGHFKQVTKYAVLEVVINLVVSIALVKPLGITGVAVGTMLSMLYRQLAHVHYLQDKILNRSYLPFMKKAVVFGLSCLVVFVFTNSLLNDEVITYFDWIILALKQVAICAFILVAASAIFFRSSLFDLIRGNTKMGEKQ